MFVDRCSPEQQALTNGLLALIDAHEAVLASQGDYAPLRDAFGDHRVMRLLAAMTHAAPRSTRVRSWRATGSRAGTVTSAPWSTTP